MDAANVLPGKITRCPSCNSPVKDIVYGLVAEPLGDGEILAGCKWETDSPTKGCSKCGWRGGAGGRTFETETSCFSVDAESDGDFDEDVNLTSLSIDQLYECGKFNLNARYELVFRGIDAMDVDVFYDQFDSGDAAPLPLIATEVTIAYYNSDTELIEQVCYFRAKGYQHAFKFLRPGMSSWGSADDNMAHFHQTVFSMKKEGVSGWLIKPFDEKHELSPQDNFGSPIFEEMMARQKISREELESQAIELDITVFWPYWFEPAFYVR